MTGLAREGFSWFCLEMAQSERLSKIWQFLLGCVSQLNLRVRFPMKKVASQLRAAHVFVAPLTGTSLREAALCGLPIVAYDRDWIRGLLQYAETALLSPSRDVEDMAEQVKRLIVDPALALKIGTAAQRLAMDLWTANSIPSSMANLEAHLSKDKM